MAHPAAARDLDLHPDIAAVRSHARDVMIACDEWHDDPFDPQARARILELLNNSQQADEAWQRLQRRRH
ncbi:MAG: hypothetical protein PHQ28_02955 [Mycobacterium sp.]|nr:hypothetical protein [Mycobacterium sp.]